ncbi:hypothetical protein LOAG_11333 [Loa loa]|uniref:Uncharacterized protein n=1 Tax=Loa loa TaxID=7209 RepID=A0A1I7W4S8_LOALO|nr:hypothetical protein LOAG_11333 [Loa loa]EFO17168.2 hypothetical protein LOAG_11333 [Loa loa]
MFSPNQSGNRISITRSDKTNRVPYVPHKQLEQRKHQKQPYWGPDNTSGEESISIRLPLLLNKSTNTSIQSSSTGTATSRLPPPPPPPRSAATSLSLFPASYQRITQQDVSSDRRLSSELLQIRLEAVSKPYWAQASLSIFTEKILVMEKHLFSSILYLSY